MRSATQSEKSLLAKYHARRQFEATPEPTGSKRLGLSAKRRSDGMARFVVQKHHASHLHYDFRLEAGGVLKSWAIPKGPSLNPSDRRLAMQVEDHPLDYYDFEGVIPAGNYGAGEVLVWDWGTYEPVDAGDAADAIEHGKIKLRMHGKKLEGGFTLVRMRGKGADDHAWLLLKERDASADPRWSAEAHDASVKTGRTLDDLEHDPTAEEWVSSRPSKESKRHAATTRATRPRKPSARKARLPHVTQPMLATLVDAPFDDPAWLFEIKWDGFRALCTVREDGSVALVSRNGKDLLPRFPSLAGLGSSFGGAPLLIDGEIVALDAKGKSSFQALQGRPGKGPLRVAFVAFDVLYAEGRDLRGEPLEARKAVLERLVEKGSTDVLYSAHVVGEGRRLFAAAEAEGLEGIIGKRRDSTYAERRTRDWVKIKAQHTQECVIVGWTAPVGAREDFGALVLATYERGALRYAGNVGTGFTRDALRAIMAKLEPLATAASPLTVVPRALGARTRSGAQRVSWVKPKLVAQIRFTEWTKDGLMRHPAFLGLRDDKKAKECSRERPRAARKLR